VPRDNEADLEDIPADVREVLQFHAVATLEEAFEIALLPSPRPVTASKTIMEEEEEEAAAIAGLA
jgi:ATP-dependent Lon protease